MIWLAPAAERRVPCGSTHLPRLRLELGEGTALEGGIGYRCRVRDLWMGKDVCGLGCVLLMSGGWVCEVDLLELFLGRKYAGGRNRKITAPRSCTCVVLKESYEVL